MGAGAVWVIPITMVLDINAVGGVQVPPILCVTLIDIHLQYQQDNYTRQMHGCP